MDDLKETFLQRYKNIIKGYFDHPGGEGQRAQMYVMDEYKKILMEVFGYEKEEVEEIYTRMYWQWRNTL